MSTDIFDAKPQVSEARQAFWGRLAAKNAKPLCQVLSSQVTLTHRDQGLARTLIGETEIEWAPHEVFESPSWQTVRHFAAEPAVLFSFSDREAHRALAIWPEETLRRDERPAKWHPARE